MNKRGLLCFQLPPVILFMTSTLVGCQNTSTSTSYVTTIPKVNENLPLVVVTTSVLCDLTKQIAGETINITCLIPADADPHLYQPKLKDRKTIDQAKLIFYTGYNFEPSLTKLIKASKNNAPKIAIAEDAISKPLRFEENGETVTDPHVWHDAKNAIKIVDVISTKLNKLEPDNAKIYKINTQKITNQFTQLDKWIKLRIASIPSNKRKLITTHYAFGYYAKAYGFSGADALQGISTKENNSAVKSQAFIKAIKQANIPIIFAETTINPDMLNSIAKAAKVKASERELFADNLGLPGSEGDTYQKMMIANTRTIVEGLGGTYLKFEPQNPQN